MGGKQKHYKFIPCKTDDLGMKLEWKNESDAPTDGDWNWWMDKDGNVEFARMKEDAYDHFYPLTKHLNLHGTDWEPQSLSGYFKEIDDGDVIRGRRLTDAEAMNMHMREIDNALKLADAFPNPFSPEAYVGPSDEVKYFCCGINAHLFTDMYCYNSKGSLWFEDKKAGKLEAINDSVTELHVVRLVFALETEFNYLSIHKLGEFNFKIEFNKESDEIQLRLWRKE